MSDDKAEPSASKNIDKEQSAGVSMAEFLEAVPPSDRYTLIRDAREQDSEFTTRIATPDIRLHCPSTICSDSLVFFRHPKQINQKGTALLARFNFLSYVCSNCRQSVKTFALDVKTSDTGAPAAHCSKLGEVPRFGTATPNQLLRLLGTDRDIFLKGRQCENHGLGIGAFSYYRRVVENHKDQIFDKMIRVAAKIAPETVEALQHAKGQHQFLNAIESLKGVFPQGLLINGDNPLTLLHSALSEGLHAETDEECLQYAHLIRLVLTKMAERMGQAMKDEAELAAAITLLKKKRSPKSDSE